MQNSNIKKFIPKECLVSSGAVKIIKPPKGLISSKVAFDLESRIAAQIEVNNVNVKKQYRYLETGEKINQKYNYYTN